MRSFVGTGSRVEAATSAPTRRRDDGRASARRETPRGRGGGAHPAAAARGAKRE